MATTAPIAPPMTRPPTISHGETTPGVAMVTPIATTMPTTPKKLPWRDVTGERKPAQRHDEADGRDQIAVGGQFLGDHPLYFPARYFLTGFFLNIDSMRCVTMKPPKMLTAASADGDGAEQLRGTQALQAGRRAARRR